MAEKSSKMSRKDWRKLFKKNRRKRIRQKAAQERDRLVEQRKLANPNYLRYQLEMEQIEREAAAREEERSRYEHALWMDREREAQVAFVELKKKREEEERRKDEERERIRKEFEEQERKAKEAKQEKERLLEELRRKQQERDRMYAEYLAGIDDHFGVLKQMVDTRPGTNTCAFFGKIGVCRYGIACSSNHPTPGLSQLLVIPNFFVHPALDDRHNPEYGTDSGIEFEEEELYQCFNEFFRDIIEEFETFGPIRYIFVCRNHVPHLRGNVFIEYENVRSAAKAQQRMNGRFYASRLLHVEFRSPITWPTAVCGLFEQSRCQKGKDCNYLHLMKNPISKYRYCHAKELSSVRQSQRSSTQGSQRSQLLERSWDDIEIPAKQRTNWRWSETPEVETPRRNGSNNHVNQNKERSRHERNEPNRNSRSDRRRRSRSKERLRGEAGDRRHGKESERSERVLQSGSDRSNQRNHRKDRSRERKKRSRSRSKEEKRSSHHQRHKKSRRDYERQK